MHSVVDLRSDTVTRPTPEMRRAMAAAEVGDDVLDDDPTVHRLQERSAELMGKEAALFMPSGTMSNAVAILAHTRPGDEILLDSDAHSMLYEVGLPATVCHVLTRQFQSAHGIPTVQGVARHLHTESIHSPGTTLIMLENTHNRAGGSVIPLEVHAGLRDLGREHGIPLHLDGARLFNAVAATGIPAERFAACVDTVTFCLSKGLGAPVGSVLCGPSDWILRARRFRKMLGGGLRQSGILAAAGLYALEHHRERLADDHAHARRLAQGLADAQGLRIDTLEPATNMVYFQTTGSAAELAEALRAKGVLCGTVTPNRIRMVTHLDVDADDIDRTIANTHEVCDTLNRTS